MALLRRHLWLLALILMVLAGKAGARPVPLAGPDSAQLQQIELLHDPTGELGIGDVRAAAASGQFQTIDHPQSAGARSGHIWLRLTVWGGNDVARRYWLLLNSPLLLEAQLYTPSLTGYEAGATTSLQQPADTRVLPYHLPIFEVTPAAGRTQVYFVRLHPKTILWIAPGLLDTSELLTWVEAEQIILGLLVACHALLLLSSLWFAHHLRDRSYVWLASLTGANLLFSLGINTLLFQELLREQPQSILHLVNALWLARTPLAGGFVLSYLGYSGQRHAQRYLALLVAVAAIEWLWGLQSGQFLWARWYQMWSIAHLCVFIALAGAKTYRGHPGAALLLLAFVLPLLAAGSTAAQTLPGQSLNGWHEYGLRIGFISFMLMMHYAAIRRYQGLRLIARQAQEEALRVARAAETALEARVAARTRELGAALEVTKSALAAEEIARAEQRQFFLTMQHELRTPLAVIDAANRNLQRDLPADFEAGQLRCQRIGRAVEQFNMLLGKSLQLRRLDSAQYRQQPQWTELRPILHEACDAARLLSTSHTLVLVLSDLPQGWHCDPALTALALRTLAINAVKYTPAGTRITIRGHSDMDGLCLVIQDNGPGVPAEDLPRLFERFFRGGNATGIPGTGLGLPLARKLIKMQGGHLDVSNAEPQGLTARIWLPRHDTAPLSTPTPRPPLAAV